MEDTKKGPEENYTHLLLLGYAVLVFSVVSAVFAYVSSTQDEYTFTLGYLGLCAVTLILFVLIRRYALLKIKEQNKSTKDKSSDRMDSPG